MFQTKMMTQHVDPAPMHMEQASMNIEPDWFRRYREEQAQQQTALRNDMYNFRTGIHNLHRESAMKTKYALMLIHVRILNGRISKPDTAIVAPLRMPPLAPLEAHELDDIPPLPQFLPPAEKCPKTITEMKKLSDTDLIELLNAYDLAIDGTFKEKLERLAHFLGCLDA